MIPDAAGHEQALKSRFAAITACRVSVHSAAPLPGFEAHIDVRLPQEQIIVNAVADQPQHAVARAMDKASQAVENGLARRFTARRQAGDR